MKLLKKILCFELYLILIIKVIPKKYYFFRILLCINCHYLNTHSKSPQCCGKVPPIFNWILFVYYSTHPETINFIFHNK